MPVDTIEDLRDRLSSVTKQLNDATAQNDELQKILILKDSTIDRLQCFQEHIESQLQSAVSKKTDALGRLEEINQSEMECRHKEMDIQAEIKRLNGEISQLTDNLNKNRNEIKVMHEEHLSTTSKMSTELNSTTDELKKAKLRICQLNQYNQCLKTQLQDKVLKLQEQIDASAKVMDSYNNELDSKKKLVEFHKIHTDAQQSLIDKLIDDNDKLKSHLKETIDQCEKIESRIQSSNDNLQDTIKKKDNDIALLTHELKFANHLLIQSKCAISTDSQASAASVYSDSRLSNQITTEICSQYNDVLKKLKLKERDYNQLVDEVKILIENYQEKAEEIDATNAELSRKLMFQSANNALIEHKLENTELKMKKLKTEYEKNIQMLLDANTDLNEKKETTEKERNFFKALFRDSKNMWLSVHATGSTNNVDRIASKRSIEDGSNFLQSCNKRPCNRNQEGRSGATEAKMFAVTNTKEINNCSKSIENTNGRRSSFPLSQNKKGSTNW